MDNAWAAQSAGSVRRGGGPRDATANSSALGSRLAASTFAGCTTERSPHVIALEVVVSY